MLSYRSFQVSIECESLCHGAKRSKRSTANNHPSRLPLIFNTHFWVVFAFRTFGLEEHLVEVSVYRQQIRAVGHLRSLAFRFLSVVWFFLLVSVQNIGVLYSFCRFAPYPPSFLLFVGPVQTMDLSVFIFGERGDLECFTG